jgi:hypothetical protein
LPVLGKLQREEKIEEEAKRESAGKQSVREAKLAIRRRSEKGFVVFLKF